LQFMQSRHNGPTASRRASNRPFRGVAPQNLSGPGGVCGECRATDGVSNKTADEDRPSKRFLTVAELVRIPPFVPSRLKPDDFRYGSVRRFVGDSYRRFERIATIRGPEMLRPD